MKTFLSLFFVLIVVLSGCKPTEATITTYTHDTIRIVEKTDTVRELVIGDSLLLETLIWCDSLNQAHVLMIDSLGKALKVNVKIEGKKLVVKVKQNDYYRLSIFYKSLYEIVRDRITTKTVIQKIPNRTNHNLYIIIAVLSGIIILLIRYKK